MAEDTFRPTPRRPKNTPEGVELPGEPEGNPLDRIRNMQEAVAAETGRESDMPSNAPFGKQDSPFQMSGNIPEGLRQAIQQGTAVPTPPPLKPDTKLRSAPVKRMSNPDLRISPGTGGGSEELELLLAKLADRNTWDAIELPSKAKFYDSIPPTLHIRPMTGEEEQILATPRYVRKGKAIDMIFEKCVREPINTQELLSVDRTYLLIYLRGISYTPEYDVEIKCPECSTTFNNVINLDQDIQVTDCPEDFGPANLVGVLPTTGFNYRYRLATGEDEQAVTRYRENRLQNFDQSDDDTLLYRTALLLEEVEGVVDRRELGILLKRLPINDVAHLRNVINDPPFGIKTEIGIICAACTHEFKIDLPLESNFFFPRKKAGQTRA